ncbi:MULTISPECIES: nucleoside kinase [Fervidobacterium]|uniref:Phosphoribulokinase/uridine kinase n=1 Tax=Fervidobacterium nodosum (strain ATCC 35602 / DSM 5306 / Rt17-B1) TaxID=381764 RepID=A7HJB8_FERNB|nr:MULTISPECIES: nucleoside kinase [Fervidobacterium]ABS60001.1 phosphoribulokinase/uridine kinase [Fervidobacterium nodosum Rt17-B1]KAF2961277.1 AAA family ATPase [Fervidobacterium sp. 2310opik-2]PHJ14275.1 ATPase AAA [Fervidobacterium sp. SC_NGM5_G05]
MEMLKVYVNGNEYEIQYGSTLESIAKEYEKKSGKIIVGARMNNTIIELFRPITKSGEVTFITLDTQDGMRIYQRGLFFILHASVRNIFKDSKLKILHTIGHGVYCEIRDKDNKVRQINETDIQNLEDQMKKWVESDFKFRKSELQKSLAMDLFGSVGMEDKVKLLKYRKKKTVKVYEADGHIDYFYGYMPPSTGYLKWFKIVKYDQGFVILLPKIFGETVTVPDFKPFPKLSAVFLEYSRWLEIMEIDNVGDLNEIIAKGERAVTDLIILAEALHEKKIAMISEEIKNRKNVRLVLIAGPSSSGKTTFSKRLMVQLKASGLKPIAISLDDYFVDRERTPRDENGNYDFEALEALDVELFNRNLLDLFDGKEVEIPKFNFVLGRREASGTKMKIDKDQIIIVEGIHGLNPKLTELVPEDLKFKIYASALAQLNLDSVNRLHTTDVRLIRRMVRDSKFRGHDALATLKMWDSVRRGEEKNIFPFQENADVMFNSALVYEISVLKIFAEQLLAVVPDNEPESTEANRLLKILDYFLPITNIEDIPRTSIIREFIGRSAFRY